MKREFVKTANAQRFATAIALREARGAAESGLVVVHGRAGEGKTRTLHNWASTRGSGDRAAVMLTAYPDWTPHRMMGELAALMGIVQRGNWQAAVGEQIAEFEKPVVVDEAGFALANNAACLERLRAITDKSGTLLVLALMQRDMARLQQHDQITSRATLCAFATSTADDVAAACAQLADVQIEADLAQRIHHESQGRMRQVLDAINLVEHVARTTAGGKQRMALADMSGLRLCQDFADVASGGSRPRAGRRGAR